jgi:hypothetical protein
MQSGNVVRKADGTDVLRHSSHNWLSATENILQARNRQAQNRYTRYSAIKSQKCRALGSDIPLDIFHFHPLGVR